MTQYGLYNTDDELLFTGTVFSCAQYLDITQATFYEKISRQRDGSTKNPKVKIINLGDDGHHEKQCQECDCGNYCGRFSNHCRALNEIPDGECWAQMTRQDAVKIDCREYIRAHAENMCSPEKYLKHSPGVVATTEELLHALRESKR